MTVAFNSQILLAISNLRTSIEGRIGELCTDLSLIRQDLRNTVVRVTEAEGRISEIEDSQKSNNSDSTTPQNCQAGRTQGRGRRRAVEKEQPAHSGHPGGH